MGAAKILAVDDDEHVRRLLKDALVMGGYEVEVACDGVDATKRLRDAEFDIIITDLQMPRMDGRRLAELAVQISPGIGLIIVTAHPADVSALETFRHGAAAYLVKPVDLRDLFRAVREVERERRDISKSIRAPSGAGGPVRVESPRAGWIEFEAPSHSLYIERFTNLFQILLRRGLSEDDLDDIRIAVQELGTNAVEWGNESDPRRSVRISAIVEPGQLVLVIEDKGRGFRPTSVPNPVADPEGVAAARRAAGKRPGGYGIAMARAAMDEIFYNRAGNTVVMTKRFPGTAPAGAKAERRSGGAPPSEKPDQARC